MGNFPCVGKMKKLFFQFSNFSYIFSNVVASPDKKTFYQGGGRTGACYLLRLARRHAIQTYFLLFPLSCSQCLQSAVLDAVSAIVAFDNGGLTSRIHQRSLLYIFLFSSAR